MQNMTWLSWSHHQRQKTYNNLIYINTSSHALVSLQVESVWKNDLKHQKLVDFTDISDCVAQRTQESYPSISNVLHSFCYTNSKVQKLFRTQFGDDFPSLQCFSALFTTFTKKLAKISMMDVFKNNIKGTCVT